MVFGCSVLALAAHGAKTKKWLEWLLRAVIGTSFVVESMYIAGINTTEEPQTLWSYGILLGMAGTTGLDLVRVFRQLLSIILTALENVVSGQVFLNLIRNRSVQLLTNKVLYADSVPHMVALFIYAQTLAYLFGAINPQDWKMPSMQIPLPVLPDQLLMYNGIGLVMLSFAGVGAFISRSPRECLKRLGIVKPKPAHFIVALLIVFGTFLYDYMWSQIAGGMHQDLGAKLAQYNSGTFMAGGGMVASLVLALTTALCAGIGEETLIRGAIQPAFGIVPAGILHGALHGQFAHTPFFIVEIAYWSCLMGIVRKYTNTTTTIIGHAGYNLITVFLFSYNP